MQFKYRYQPNDNTIEVEFFDELKNRDVIQYFSVIEKDSLIVNDPIEIVDLSNVRFFNMNHFEVSDLPLSYSVVHEKKNIRAIIFVGVSEFNSCMIELVKARLLKTLPGHTILSVTSMDDAHREVQRIRNHI